LDLVDRRLLNIIQASFPLVEEPYREVGERLGISEEEVIDRIGRLKKRGVIREISAIFDTRRLGYQSCLVAMRLPRERLNKGALKINEHPGVSHNYARRGPFNLWFTLAVPPSEGLKDTVERMAKGVGAEAYHILPALRLFKIGINFNMVEGRVDSLSPSNCTDDAPEGQDKAEDLSELEVRAIRELQEDLPLTSRPFEGMARRLGITQQALFQLVHSFQERGIMRRFGAVLRHRKAGFKANALALWRVPQERSEEVGRAMASHPAVSHCYQRPDFPDLPYTLYTVLHGKSRRECQQVARELSRLTGVEDYLLLYSTKEYKKERVRYFV